MTEEENTKDEKQEEEKEDKEKSSLDSSLQALTETIKGFDINGLKKDIADVATKVDGFDARVKALETPTDLPLRPKVSADEDIGAKVKAPPRWGIRIGPREPRRGASCVPIRLREIREGTSNG